MHIPLLPLLPNRVRRNYRGGYLLDKFENQKSPIDGDRPEDWLASTVRAINPALSSIPNEGLACVKISDHKTVLLQDLFETAPDYYLGHNHFSRLGTHLGFLAKLLDSSVRLSLQAHPTAAFARESLGSPWGKLEAYIIIATRNEGGSHIRLGFQRPPSPSEWRRIVLEQDIAAMDACFDPIPVSVGDVWLVPGGLPHAIGDGILMLEVMEPSDLVVRCEFERDGIRVPPEARFMQVPVDLALQIFDYTPRSVTEVERTFKITPQALTPHEEQLIGSTQTDAFSVERVTVQKRMPLQCPDRLRIGVVSYGHGMITVADHSMSLHPGARFVLAASAPEGTLVNHSEDNLEILFCS